MSEEDHREEEVEKLQQFWRERISHWYPHLLHAAHFLPAVFMNRTRYRTETQAGQTVYVPQVPLSNLPKGDRSSFREDEAREDQALQCVLACLRHITGTRDEHGGCRAQQPHEEQTIRTGGETKSIDTWKKQRATTRSRDDTKQALPSHSEGAAQVETESEYGTDSDASHLESAELKNEDKGREAGRKDSCMKPTESPDKENVLPQSSPQQSDHESGREEQPCVTHHQPHLPHTGHTSPKPSSSAAATSSEVIFVISQLAYVNYLKDVPEHLRGLLPTPKDMEKENRHRGDFDLLIIHRYHGLFACEVKAVGDKLTSNTESETNEIISKKIVRALEQLRKAEKVLRHLVSVHEPPPRVNKCLMLPNLTRDVLRRVLHASPQLKQDLCDCLHAGTRVDVSDLVLTSDTLPHSHPCQWWQLLKEMTGPDKAMSDQLYLDLVSRFGGPATTVDMFCPAVPRLGHGGCAAAAAGCGDGGACRSLGEAVAETSWRFTRLVLHPRQLDKLREDPPLLYITGPPGTGKTTMLVLKALDWLLRGHDVHVLSTWAESRPVSSFIATQLQQTQPEAANRVYSHNLDLWPGGTTSREDPVEMAVTSLTQHIRDGVLLIVTDEVGPDSADPKRNFSRLCSRLVRDTPGPRSVRVWAASMYHRDRPDMLAEFTMTEPLRTPDTVTQEVAKCNSLGERGTDCLVLGYSPCSSPLPCRGVPPWEVLHRDEDHGQVTVVADCEQCGREVARVLREELRVGAAGTGATATNNMARSDTPSPQKHHIRFKDVALLVRLGDVSRTEEDSEGNSHHVDCGLVLGLQAGGVPVRVLSQYHDDVVTMAGPDAVLVTWSNVTVGLERTVVVWSRYDDWGEEWGRLLAMSRCTGQLVIVRKA